MKYLLTIILCLIPAIAWAGPFLVCDPQAGVTSYNLEITQGPNISTQSNIPAQTDGSLRGRS